MPSKGAARPVGAPPAGKSAATAPVAPDAGERQGASPLAHVLTSVLTAVVCGIWLWASGDIPLAPPQARAPEARVTAPDSFPDLVQAITPSHWLLSKVNEQYEANTARLMRQLNGSLPSPEVGVEIMFESPIYRLNLRDLGVEPDLLTKSVARVILREYHRRAVMGKDEVMHSLEEAERAKERAEREAAARDAVLRGEAPSAAAIAGPGRSGDGRLADGGSEEDGDTSVFNDAFFTWQSEKNGWEKMFGKHKQLEHVKAFWARAADHFLRSMGHAAVFEGHPRHRQPEMHSWATVHKDCVFHGMHHHGEDIMSGVFYVKVPPGAGSISFFDPRGETGRIPATLPTGALGAEPPLPSSHRGAAGGGR